MDFGSMHWFYTDQLWTKFLISRYVGSLVITIFGWQSMCSVYLLSIYLNIIDFSRRETNDLEIQPIG